jgi:2-keto-4-pentenoate hydratase/2-oxohepta-3-ene-1,7-dioic acid hydratase in catechol pathway
MFTPKELDLERGWPGRIEGDRVVQLAAQTLQAYFTGGGTAREHAEWPLAEVRLRPPVLHPPSVRDFMAFEQHVQTTRRARGSEVPPEWYEIPAFYFSNPAAIYGPDDEIPYPEGTEKLDYELEVAAVIGADGAIAGFTVMNDWSARDLKRKEMAIGLGPAKGKDFATALGPWIVTTDELELGSIEAEARVNGEVWGRGSSGDAMWTAAEVVAYLSTAEPLVPGELVGSGTFGGACGLEVGRQLTPGDRVELEAAGIGTLTTELGEPDQLVWEPSAREPGRTISGGRAPDYTELLPPRADAPAPPYPQRVG